MKKYGCIISKLNVIFFLSLLSLSSCGDHSTKRIFYINSYHDGYPSSDDIREGITEVLEGKDLKLEIFYLDSKQNPEEEMLCAKVNEALERIDKAEPDLIIASDDNAVGLLVSPHLQDRGIPIVFCGVNWSAEQYALGEQVTGMLEVMPLRETIQTIKNLNPDIKRIAVLSENSRSEQNNTRLLDTLYSNLGMKVEYHLVEDFEAWKEAFKKVSISTDLIYMPTNGAIANWDRQVAMAFVEDNLNVPTITCDDFMMDYCVFGLTKVATEQGRWAAETALRILNGTLPSEIPVTRNSQFQAYLNERLARVMGFNLLEEPEGLIRIK